MSVLPAPIQTAAARLRHASWLDQIKCAYLIMLGGIFVLFCLPSSIKHLLRPLLPLAALLPIVAKDLAHLPDAAMRLRHALAGRRWHAIPAALLPPELLGLVRLDRAIRAGFMGWLLRRPRPSLPPGRAFTYLEQGAYRSGFAFLLFCCVVEMPLDAAIMPLLVHDAAERKVIHLLMLASSVSSLVWALGDRWLIGAGRHVLTRDGLLLQIGARTSGLVAAQAIVRCERLEEPVAQWCRRHGVDPRATVNASPLDKPNTVLICKPDSPVRLTHLGMERSGLACVFLYIDRPDDLVQALAPA